MPRDPAHLPRSRPLQMRRRLAAACVLFGLAALGAAFLVAHPAAGWVVLNVLLWGAPGLLACVFARELFRALLARTLGFHVFEIQWGAGRAIGSARIGSCTLRLAALPLLGHVEAATASPHQHRTKRWAIACAPALAQAALAPLAHHLLLHAEPAASEALAPLAVLQAANLALLALHLLLPFETRSGLRSDVRRAFDLLAATPECDRAERAVFYVQSACLRIRNEDFGGAREILDRGRRALGPEPVLLALDERLDRFVRSGVPAQLFRFEDPRASLRSLSASKRASLARSRRLGRALVASTPLLVGVMLAVVVERGRLTEGLELSWSRSSRVIATGGERADCRAALAHGSRWLPRLDAIHRASAGLRRARHDAFAALYGCLDDPEQARLQQSEAVAATREQANALVAHASTDAVRRTAAENAIELARQQRRLAHWQAECGAFRESLATLAGAGRELEQARRWRAAVDENEASESLEIELARASVLGRMGAFEQARRIYDALLEHEADPSATTHEHALRLERAASAYREAQLSWPTRTARATPSP